MKQELLYDFMLCPNTTEFTIKKAKTFSETYASMHIKINATDITKFSYDEVLIYSFEIVRYFTPEDYKENQFENSISLTKDLIWA